MDKLADQPDAGDEAADTGRVVTVGRTVFVAQVRFLDLAHLQLDRGNGEDQAGESHEIRCQVG